MSINGIDNNTANVALNAAIAGAQDAQSAQNAQGATETSDVVLSGDSLTVTDSSASRRTEATAAGRATTPEAALTDAVVDGTFKVCASLDALADQLKVIADATGEKAPTVGASKSSYTQKTADEVIKDLNKIGATSTPEETEEAIENATSSSSTQKVFSSIYDLMALMLEVGQQQRDAARELKQAELDVSVASIESQAEYQRTGAKLGFMVTVITCAVQLALTVVSTGFNAKDAAKGGQGHSKYGVVGTAVGQLGDICGKLGTGLSQMVQGLYNAAATEESANEKEADANREETNTLMQQAQDLIDTARQTLLAVYQAESQLNEKIIQA